VRRICDTEASSSINGSGIRRSRPVPGTDDHTASAKSASRISASAVTINAPTNAM
jgi:hypothetical protein